MSQYNTIDSSQGEIPDKHAQERASPDARSLRAHKIYDEIRYRICTNRLAPGERIGETELANEFNVSRSPIRHVMAKLEQEELVEVRHGVGTRVTMIDTDALIEIYMARMAMMEATSAFFVDPLPSEIVHDLMRFKTQFSSLEKMDLLGFADTNLAYFLALTNLVENDCMRQMHVKLFYRSSRIWTSRLSPEDWDTSLENIAKEIDETARAIQHNDPKWLAFAMRNALAAAREYFLEVSVS